MVYCIFRSPPSRPVPAVEPESPKNSARLAPHFGNLRTLKLVQDFAKSKTPSIDPHLGNPKTSKLDQNLGERKMPNIAPMLGNPKTSKLVPSFVESKLSKVDLPKTSFARVRVTEVFSPSEFYIVLEQNLDLLKKIYSNLLDNIDLPVLSRSGVIF